MTESGLITEAKKAREMAYSPYSGFKVGAALLTSTGKVYTGCNVENASYGLTVCAERTAILKAVSEGEIQFTMLAVYAESDPICSPCGACRQFLAEFGPDIIVIMANHKGDRLVKTLKELLPYGFTCQNFSVEDKNP